MPASLTQSVPGLVPKDDGMVGIGALMASNPERAAMVLASRGVGPAELMQVAQFSPGFSPLGGNQEQLPVPIQPDTGPRPDVFQIPPPMGGGLPPPTTAAAPEIVPQAAGTPTAGYEPTPPPAPINMAGYVNASPRPDVTAAAQPQTQISDLLNALKGVQAPPVPEAQRLQTPNPPTVHPPAGGGVADTLRQIIALSMASKLPETLRLGDVLRR